MKKPLIGIGILALVMMLVVALPVGLAITVVISGGANGAQCLPGGEQPPVRIDPSEVPEGPIAGYNHEQLVNAAQIAAAIADLGMSRRDQQVAVMTSMMESTLRNLPQGPGTSLGLFQQKDNGAWGSRDDRLDPYTAARNFGLALGRIDARPSKAPEQLATLVQANGGPAPYAPFWDPAVTVVDGLAEVVEQPPITAQALPASDLGYVVYGEDQLTPRTHALIAVLAPMFGIRVVGGWRDDRDSEHYLGRAADFMVPADESFMHTPEGRQIGQALADYAQAHAAELGVEYIIWRQQIWSVARAAEGWRDMADRGDNNVNHYNHVHITALAGDGPVAPVPTPVQPIGCTEPVSGGWAWPLGVDAPVTQSFGTHTGTDFGEPCGTPFVATASGTVTETRDLDGVSYGRLLTIDHGGGVVSRYAHMASFDVSVGDQVSVGEVVGHVGNVGNSTGCHLHFEILVNGQFVDPEAWLNEHVGQQVAGAAIVAASFNVLGASHTDAGIPGTKKPAFGPSSERMRGVVQLLEEHQVSIVGFQEFEGPQANAFDRLGSDRWTSWHPPGDTRRTIAWQRDQWEMVDSHTFPIPYFENDVPTPVVLLQRRDGSGQRVWVMNVHNPADTKARGANSGKRAEALRRELDQAKTLIADGIPLLMVGDFNDRENAFCPVTAAGLHASAGGTNTGGECHPPPSGVDWVFGGGLTFVDHIRDSSSIDQHISDHAIVVATTTPSETSGSEAHPSFTQSFR